jgi:heme exporter protein D
MDLGPHGFFIVAAYAAAALIVAALILRAIIDYRGQLAALAELEARGARRRSEPSLGGRERSDRRPATGRVG